MTHQPTNLALIGLTNCPGRMAADYIASKEITCRGNLDTSVCKVFSKAIGLVGLSSEILRHRHRRL